MSEQKCADEAARSSKLASYMTADFPEKTELFIAGLIESIPGFEDLHKEQIDKLREVVDQIKGDGGTEEHRARICTEVFAALSNIFDSLPQGGEPEGGSAAP